MAHGRTLSNLLWGRGGILRTLNWVLLLGGFAFTASAARNITTPPVVIPLSLVYNTTFDPAFPGRFITPVGLGNPPQNLMLKLDIESPDLEIRQDSPNIFANNPIKKFLFVNQTSSSFFLGEPANAAGWLGLGPTDNITIGSLTNFQTGWNRWNATDTVNLSNQQIGEMITYSISGSFGLHGPQCPVDGESWVTSLVVGGGVPFRVWGIYFDGGVDDLSSTFLDGDAPTFRGILLLGGYQPSMINANPMQISNITFNNQLPNSPPGTNSPHLLRIDSFSVNGKSAVAPLSAQEAMFRVSTDSLFSNFSTRAQASAFAQAVGANAQNDQATGRTTYTFSSCNSTAQSQNVELVFPPFLGSPATRITIPPQSLKIRKGNTCYLSFQEPWDPPAASSMVIPSRGILGLSFLRNVYFQADYDAGAYSLTPRSSSPASSPNPLAVFTIPNPAKFVLDACWAPMKLGGDYEDNWKIFPMMFREYYGVVIGPPWISRSGRVVPAGIFVLAFLIIPVVGGVLFFMGTIVEGYKKGRR